MKIEDLKEMEDLELSSAYYRLKEEITNLSKDVDMWNAKYNDMFDENKELKKQLENKEIEKEEYDDIKRN